MAGDTSQGGTNYATLKEANHYVVIEATLSPNANPPAGKLVWSGGEAVTGKPKQRRVSTSSTKKVVVKATVGKKTLEVTIWVFWASVTIQTSGTAPAAAPSFLILGIPGGQNLGATLDGVGYQAWGKVCIIGKLEPTGVGAVVKSGWDIRQWKWVSAYIDGEKSVAESTTIWKDDSGSPRTLTLEPDGQGQIYHIDAPNISRGPTGTKFERYMNFYDLVLWNGEVCSAPAYWYWKGQWDSSAIPEVTLAEVGTGNQMLP